MHKPNERIRHTFSFDDLVMIVKIIKNDTFNRIKADEVYDKASKGPNEKVHYGIKEALIEVKVKFRINNSNPN